MNLAIAFLSKLGTTMERSLLLISSSKVHGYGYLEAAQDEIKDFLSVKNVSRVLFIPYANKHHDKYYSTVQPAFQSMGYVLDSIHLCESPTQAVKDAKAIFVGGGNTFLLLKTLYDHNLVELIHKRVTSEGLLYMGSSAGTNVATRSIHTTNDMPIVYPPSFDALNLVPFNINPHYIENELLPSHKGETRDERLTEYLEMEHAGPVLGLREGTMLRVDGNRATLKGITNAKLFVPDKAAVEFVPNSDLSFLL